MYLDFSQSKQTTFEADVCIIGAGAAGFSCAVNFLNSGLKVLLLEGGLKTYNSKAASLHRAEVTGQPHTGIHEARERIVGGTTTKWGGQALPFMPEDFQKRSYVDQSGWPLSYDQLAPYYKKAEKILGTDAAVGFSYNPWEDWKIKGPRFTKTKLELIVTKWCKIPNFATQHFDKIEASANLTLLANANVVELLPNPALDEVAEVRIRSLNKKEGTIKVNYVIAAGGALECVRLFLASKKFGHNGLGNQNNLVGRYFQDHVATIVGRIFPSSKKGFNDIFDPFYKNGYKYLPRIRVMPAFAHTKKILHASAQIVFTDGEENALSNMKALASAVLKKQKPDRRIIKMVFHPKNLLKAFKAGLRWKLGRRGSSPMNGPVWLEVHSEQNPVAENRIELSSAVDELGMPRIRLRWSISELTVNTIRETAKLLQQEFAQSSICTVVLEPWVNEAATDPRRWMGDVFHQAGGLRMAATSEEGVVNASCKVFGVHNLYVASSAVFPTSSFSNPTMTTIALSVRISEEVLSRCKQTAARPLASVN